MLKFFLRLYLLLTLGFAASLLLIDKAANAYFAPYVEQFNREAVREVSRVILETLPATDLNIADIPVEEGIARLYTGKDRP